MERSRTGCTTCRKRKRKCDETKPECRACTSRGVQCGGYARELRWGNAVASRGHLAGATTPVRNPATQQQQQQQHHHNTLHQRALVQAQDSPVGSHSSPGSDGTTSRISVQDDVDPTFEKFLRIGLRRLYASRTDAWVETMFRDLSADSVALCAVGAAIQTYVEEGLSLRALQQIDHAIQTLRQELALGDGALSASTMCACLLVCSLQLFEGGLWTSNLKLMTDLYRLGGDLDVLHPDPQHDVALRHQLEVLSMMDISFLVVGRTTPSVGLWTRFRKLQDSWAGGRLKGNEPVSGLPRSLLDVLARSSERGDSHVETELWQWSGELGQLVQCQHWDAFKYAAILRLRRCRQYHHHSDSSDAAAATISAESATAAAATAENNSAAGTGTGTGPGCCPVPPSEVVLYRLLSCLEALLNGLARPEYHELLATHSMFFPLAEASLMVTLLKKHQDWVQPLRRLRDDIIAADASPRNIAINLFGLLDQAWDTGQDFFDINKAAQARGMEIAVF